jgi:hypothetical protein
MGTEGEEVQAQMIGNIDNKIKAKNSPNLRKTCTSRYRRPLGLRIDMAKIVPLYSIVQLKH